MRDKLIKFRGDRTQTEMASKYGVSQQAWSKWERGIDAPKLLVMKRLETDSEIPMEDLFFDVFNNLKSLNPAQSDLRSGPDRRTSTDRRSRDVPASSDRRVQRRRKTG